MLTPLLAILKELGGSATSAEVAERLADHFRLTPEQRSAQAPVGRSGHTVNYWRRHVRWVYQRAKLQGLATGASTTHAPHSVWQLTQAGEDFLQTATPGVVRLVYATENGIAIWGDAMEAFRYLNRGEVNLAFVSPPYPTEKEYGAWDEEEWLETFVPIINACGDLLAPDGSLLVNLGVHYRKGVPALSLYHLEFVRRMVRDHGWYLCFEEFWENPAKLPAPAQYVTIQRVRCKLSAEHIYWFSRTPFPKADNRRVLQPYSAAQRDLMRRGWRRQHRPSGHDLSGDFTRDNGGSIPGNVIRIANTASNSQYQRLCRQAGIKPHPARFPLDLVRRAIRMLTDPGDVVMDFFAGSCTTAQAAEEEGRRWVCIEKALYYLTGSVFRFKPEALTVCEPLRRLLPEWFRSQLAVGA